MYSEISTCLSREADFFATLSNCSSENIFSLGAKVMKYIKNVTAKIKYRIGKVVKSSLPLNKVTDIIPKTIKTIEDKKRAIKKIQELGPKFVIIKGGHDQGKICHDILYGKLSDGRPIFEFCTSPKIEGVNLHGTGCIFSSAIATYLSKGVSISIAFKKSHAFIQNAIANGRAHSLKGLDDHYLVPVPT